MSRRMKVILIAFQLISIMGITPAEAFNLISVSFSPSPPIAGASFSSVMAIGAGSSPVSLLGSTVSVDGNTIRIEAQYSAGPWATPGASRDSFEIPPVDAGEYEIQLLIWNEERQEMEQVATTNVAVQHQNRVPALGLPAVIMMIAMLALAGSKLLQR